MDNYTWEYIQSHPKETKRLLGINYEQLEELIEYLLIKEEAGKKEEENKKIRINQAGSGRKKKISKEEQIILTLIYLRHHINFNLLGLIFHLSESTANNIFNYWQDLLEEALPSSLLEQAKKYEENQEKIRNKLKEYELIVDREEQEIERSLSYEEQKKHFSGKKRTHSFKNQVISLPKGQDIVDIVAGETGPKSDIKIWRESQNKFDKKQKFSGDKAYIGESQITIPKKKPKNGELTREEKEANKKISSKRIFVEHLIRIIKIFKVARERFRLSKDRYESILLTICGLVRLRKGSLIIEHLKNCEKKENIDAFISHIFS